MKLELLCKGAFALAALVASGTYAWNTFTGSAETVHADGVPSMEGYDVQTPGFNQQGGFIVITKSAEDPTEPGKKHHTLTVYELRKTGGEGEGKLMYLGSRAMDWDAGLPLIKFKEEDDKAYSPNSLKEAMEKAAKGKRR